MVPATPESNRAGSLEALLKLRQIVETRLEHKESDWTIGENLAFRCPCGRVYVALGVMKAMDDAEVPAMRGGILRPDRPPLNGPDVQRGCPAVFGSGVTSV